MFFYSETTEQVGSTDQYFSNVSLLLKADGENNSTTFIDSSANNFAISRFGNTRIDSFSPHNKEDGKWSIYFPSQADSIRKNYLLVGGTTSSGNIGTNWTFETWFRGSSSSQRGIIAAKSDMNSDTGNSWVAGVVESGAYVGKFYFNAYHGTGWPVNIKSFFSVSRVDDGNWHHLAFVKQGTTYRIFVDGVLESQEVFGTSINAGTAENVTIGGSTPNPNGGDYGRTDCYLSNLRISTTAVYTSAFSPPTTPLESVSGTFLLTCQGRIFSDNGPNNYSITIGRGSPSISDVSPLANAVTAITGSAYFDGNGDYLSVPTDASLEFGSGNYTIEMWINPAGGIANGTLKYLFGKRQSLSVYGGVLGFLEFSSTSNAYRAYYYTTVNGTTWAISAATGYIIPTNTWTHLAFVRNGNTFTVFVNGTSAASGTASGTIPSNSQPFVIGSVSSTDPGANGYLGYMDDIRITKGVARYTESFTPPDSLPTTGA